MRIKIVSGGQTGADRAALDAAIKFNIPHGGWIPRGRITEQGRLPDLYQLKETATPDYPERTRKNIEDSQGTVVISRGKLTGGSKLTLTHAKLRQKPHCYIDLFSNDMFEAAIILQSFILENHIEVLNVAGPRASSDPAIYHDVKSIIEAALYLFYLDSPNLEDELPAFPMLESTTAYPENKTQALGQLEDALDLKMKTQLARLPMEKRMHLYFFWLDPMKHYLGLDDANHDLVIDLKKKSLHSVYTPEDAVMDILKDLLESMRKTYGLRIVS